MCDDKNTSYAVNYKCKQTQSISIHKNRSLIFFAKEKEGQRNIFLGENHIKNE